MPTRQILFDDDAHAKIAKGVETVARAVGSTMGPRGRAVAIATNDPFRPPVFTVDGVTVANNVELSDPFERVGADAVRTASRKSNSDAGDGTTAAAVLTHAIYQEGSRRVRNGENCMALKAQIEKECAEAVKAENAKLKAFGDALELELGLKELREADITFELSDEKHVLLTELLPKVGTEGVVKFSNVKAFAAALEAVSAAVEA